MSARWRWDGYGTEEIVRGRVAPDRGLMHWISWFDNDARPIDYARGRLQNGRFLTATFEKVGF
jgi:hypothetical protein